MAEIGRIDWSPDYQAANDFAARAGLTGQNLRVVSLAHVNAQRCARERKLLEDKVRTILRWCDEDAGSHPGFVAIADLRHLLDGKG